MPSLRQKDSKDFGIGKVTDLPAYVKNGRVIIRDFSDEVGYGYGGSPSLINWKDIIDRFGIKGINDDSLFVKELRNKIDKSRVMNRESYIAMKIHAELINFKEFEKVVKDYDMANWGEIEDTFLNQMINYKNFSEYAEVFNITKGIEFKLATRIFEEVVKAEELDDSINRSRLKDYGYASKQLNDFLKEFKIVKEQEKVKSIHEAILKHSNFEMFVEEFENKKQLELEIANKIFEKVINTNRLRPFLEKFAAFKKEASNPGLYGQSKWLNIYALAKSFPKDIDLATHFPRNYSMACMTQWFFALQMKEAIIKIHSQKGEILFEMPVQGIDNFSLGAISYILNFGFDGVKIILERDKDVSADKYREILNIDNFRKINFVIKSINDSAKVYISTSDIYIEKLKEILEECADDDETINKVDFILSRKISEIDENERLPEDALIEIDASPADQELWTRLIDKLKTSNIREIAVAAGDLEFEGTDLDYRLPADINNRPMFDENLFSNISRLIEFRPQSPELLVRIGYRNGLRFIKIPSLSEKEWKNLYAKRNNAGIDINLADLTSNSKIFGLILALYNFFNNNELNDVFAITKDERHIFRLLYETLNNSEGLNERDWAAGWQKIKKFEKMALRKSASLEEKACYVVEMFGFLRGILEKMTENHNKERIEKYFLAKESDKKTLITLLTMENIFGIEEGKEYEIPAVINQTEPELLNIVLAKTPEDLEKNYTNIMQVKLQNVYKIQSITLILFVEALLNFQELKKKYPEKIALPKELDNLFTDNKFMNLLGSIFGIIKKTGIIPELTSQDDEEPIVSSWVVNELFNLFDMFAEKLPGHVFNKWLERDDHYKH